MASVQVFSGRGNPKAASQLAMAGGAAVWVPYDVPSLIGLASWAW